MAEYDRADVPQRRRPSGVTHGPSSARARRRAPLRNVLRYEAHPLKLRAIAQREVFDHQDNLLSRFAMVALNELNDAWQRLCVDLHYMEPLIGRGWELLHRLCSTQDKLGEQDLQVTLT